MGVGGIPKVTGFDELVKKKKHNAVVLLHHREKVSFEQRKEHLYSVF